CSAWS
ncbi:Protein of unknown function, partial [Gryllus bimaculatus]